MRLLQVAAAELVDQHPHQRQLRLDRNPGDGWEEILRLGEAVGPEFQDEGAELFVAGLLSQVGQAAQVCGFVLELGVQQLQPGRA